MIATRRRFLTLAAAALGAGPSGLSPPAPVTRWAGLALGAEAAITLRGPTADAAAALTAVQATIARMQGLFSLYDPQSALSRLNRHGYLHRPDPDFRALLDLCDRIHRASAGRFDPTIQPLWRALAEGRGAEGRGAEAVAAARAAVGWDGVARTGDGADAAIRLTRPGMALTFNGIAQGYATDRVVETLALHGFVAVLVNIGEYRAGDGAWRIGVDDPDFGRFAIRSLRRRALAVSSPGAMRLSPAGAFHILDPHDPATRPLWSSVAVTADSAALADGFSTAFCFLDRPTIRAIMAGGLGITAVDLLDPRGRHVVV